MSEREVLVVVGVGLLGLIVASWVRDRERARDVPQGKLTGFALPEVAYFLMAEYDLGRIHPRALDAARQRPPPWFDLRANTINSFVCVDIACGRYREALEWRARWSANPSGDDDVLLKINEAEALACLGRREESLALVASLEPRVNWLRTAQAAHRAWVLSELGRVDEARVQLAHPEFGPAMFPHNYVAELGFSRFAVALAARDLDAAQSVLDETERFLVRESSRRNLHFYRGRLALAQGKPEHAVEHFERGGQSVYRAQGGASLVEWGDALMHLGRREEAREKWQRCLGEDPQAPAATAAKARLAA